MYKCKICGKEYENRYSFLGHCSSHNRGKSYREKRKKLRKKSENYYIEKKQIHKCEYCGKEFESGVSLGGHVGRCKLNPNYNKTIELMKLNSTGKKHSQTTKDKISKSMIKYLTEHPNRVPYLLNHSSKISYPEEIFKNALNEMNIVGWVIEYKHSIYSYDFAWPEYKIDVEIDGSTHNSEKVKKIDYRRDEFSKSKNWIVIRFAAKEVKENVVKCINIVLKEIIKVRS